MFEYSFFPKPSVSLSHRPSWHDPLPVDGRIRSTGQERLSVWTLLAQWQELFRQRLQRIQPLLRPGLRLVVCGGLLWIWGAGQEGSQVPHKVRTFQKASFQGSASFPHFLASHKEDFSVSSEGESASRLQKSSILQKKKHTLEKKTKVVQGSGRALRRSLPKNAVGQEKPVVLGTKNKTSAVARRVFVISWDGAKSSVVREMLDRGKLPFLGELLRGGKGTFAARTVIPSLTLPSHTSMLTGLTVKHHGVRWNRFQHQRGVVRFPTILDLASRKGFSSGFFVSKKKLMHLVRARDRYVVVRRSLDALGMVSELLSHLQRNPLQLVFWHLRDPDRAGHWFGWGNEERSPAVEPSRAYRKALIRSDEALGRLMHFLRARGWWKETAVILTADHGGHDRTHGTAHAQDRLIPWIVGGGALQKKRCVLSRPIETYDTAATALSLLGVPRPAGMDGRVRLHCP